MSVNTEMTALADAIRSKSNTTGKLSIAGMKAAVDSITINPPGDVDLTGVTVTVDKLLEGVIAVDATGSKITGTIPNVSAKVQDDAVVVPAGFHEQAQSFPITGGVDLSTVTVTESDILKGRVAIDSEGRQITGNIETVAVSRDGNTVIVPAGFHPTEETFECIGDLSFITAVDTDIREGKISVDKDGNVVIGTIADSEVTNSENTEESRCRYVLQITSGYLPNTLSFAYNPEYPELTATAADIAKGKTAIAKVEDSGKVTYVEVTGTNEATSTDLSFVTAKANDILAGKVGADINGNPVTGTIAESTVTVNKNVVTLTGGHVASKKEVTVGTARESTTITPGTSWKQIPADTYCVGAQYIAGDENLIPENIPEDMSFFGIQGTRKMSGGETVTFGYIDEWGKFQAIDLSATPPVDSGESVETDLVTFALPDDTEDPIGVTAYDVYIDSPIADILNKDKYKWCLKNIEGNLLLSDDSISGRTMYGGVRADGTEYRLIWYPSLNCYVLLRGYTDILCELTGKINPSYLDGTYTALDGTTVIISNSEA